MTPLSRRHRRWLVVVLFAIAMAWVEAACVYYLRILVDRVDPFQANPLPLRGVLGQVELVREAATLVMLATLGSLAGRTRTARLGYAAVAFGTWDIFYYVFLRLIGGWPRSVFDWDILFLIPLPWWGPVLAPLLIASLMVVGGTWATHPGFTQPATVPSRASWGLHGLGIALALYVFMDDAFRALSRGQDVRQVVPAVFDWPLFWVALACIAAPLAQITWRRRGRRQRLAADVANRRRDCRA